MFVLLLDGAGGTIGAVLLKVTLLYTACAEGAVTLLTAVLLTCEPANDTRTSLCAEHARFKQSTLHDWSPLVQYSACQSDFSVSVPCSTLLPTHPQWNSAYQIPSYSPCTVLGVRSRARTPKIFGRW